LTDWTINSVFR